MYTNTPVSKPFSLPKLTKWLTVLKYPSLSLWVYNTTYTPHGPCTPCQALRYVTLKTLRWLCLLCRTPIDCGSQGVTLRHTYFIYNCDTKSTRTRPTKWEQNEKTTHRLFLGPYKPGTLFCWYKYISSSVHYPPHLCSIFVLPLFSFTTMSPALFTIRSLYVLCSRSVPSRTHAQARTRTHGQAHARPRLHTRPAYTHTHAYTHARARLFLSLKTGHK